MKLVKFDNWKLVITEEALLISAFAALWKRDKSKDKTNALRDFSVMYFLCDPRSDYMFISDYNDRLSAIKEQEGLPETWQPDTPLLKAMEVYKKLTQTTSSLLLEDTRALIDKVREQMKEIDLKAVDDKGKPLYTLNTITSTIKQIPALTKDLREAEEALAKEVEEVGRMRGQKAKKILEDGIFGEE